MINFCQMSDMSEKSMRYLSILLWGGDCLTLSLVAATYDTLHDRYLIVQFHYRGYILHIQDSDRQKNVCEDREHVVTNHGKK